jgi:hypothetical protein
MAPLIELQIEHGRSKLCIFRGFEKGDMHVVITIESTTTKSSIPTF